MANKNEKKKRIPSVHVELREEVHFHWNEKEKCFELRNSEGEVSNKHLVSMGEIYNRNGKQPKVLRQLQNPTGGVISINPKSIIYDRYMAIDTNYKSFGKNLMCATSSLFVKQHLGKSGRLMKGEQINILVSPRLIFLAKLGTKPERYGWMRMIDALLKSNLYNAEWSYGVIVDSDLDELQKINAREKSIIDDFFVPNNISLIYASADVGKESLLNKLIKSTDQVAKISLDSVLDRFDGQESFEISKNFWDITTLNDVVKTAFSF